MHWQTLQKRRQQATRHATSNFIGISHRFLQIVRSFVGETAFCENFRTTTTHLSSSAGLDIGASSASSYSPLPNVPTCYTVYSAAATHRP